MPLVYNRCEKIWIIVIWRGKIESNWKILTKVIIKKLTRYLKRLIRIIKLIWITIRLVLRIRIIYITLRIIQINKRPLLQLFENWKTEVVFKIIF